MAGNLPDGVSGSEYEIAGPDWERDDERECLASEPTITVMTPEGLAALKRLKDMAYRWEFNEVTLKSCLDQIESSIEDVNLPDYCPFVGNVTVQGYRGTERWTCPLCCTEHDREISE